MEFWNMIPGAAMFSEIFELPAGQRRVIMTLAEDAFSYNQENEEHLTLKEYYNMVFPHGISSRGDLDDRDQEEPE